MSLRDQRGIITVDFVFSMVLVLGMSSLLFVLTFTLSVASLTQYVTFATARNYAAANIDLAAQEARAKMKYQELLGNPSLKPLFTNGWYQVEAEPDLGDLTKVIPGWTAASEGFNEFWGAGTNFTAKVLDFNIPFFGSTSPDGDGTGSEFKTYLSSSLGREPTEAECIAFTAARWAAIRNLAVSGGASYSTGTSENGYFPMTDDGC
jgi:hypothetical protein